MLFFCAHTVGVVLTVKKIYFEKSGKINIYGFSNLNTPQQTCSFIAIFETTFYIPETVTFLCVLGYGSDVSLKLLHDLADMEICEFFLNKVN